MAASNFAAGDGSGCVASLMGKRYQKPGTGAMTEGTEHFAELIAKAVRAAFSATKISAVVTVESEGCGREKITIEGEKGYVEILLSGTPAEPKFSIFGAPTWQRGKMFLRPSVDMQWAASGDSQRVKLGWSYAEIVSRIKYRVYVWRVFVVGLRNYLRDFSRMARL